MSDILFLSASYSEHPMDADRPLLLDDLRSVSACLIRPGAAKDEFLKVKHWVLMGPDDYEDLCVTLNSWCFLGPQAPIILGFDGLFLIRRLAGNCARRGMRFIPAVWWSGNQSRCYDVMRYLCANEPIEPAELLKAFNIECLPIYEPHKDPKQDLCNLIKLADKLNLVNERLSVDLVGPVDLPTPQMDLAVKPAKQQKTKTLKAIV